MFTCVYLHPIEEKIMEAKITLLPGDGIGPEVVNEAKKVLTAVAHQHNHTVA